MKNKNGKKSNSKNEEKKRKDEVFISETSDSIYKGLS